MKLWNKVVRFALITTNRSSSKTKKQVMLITLSELGLGLIMIKLITVSIWTWNLNCCIAGRQVVRSTQLISTIQIEELLFEDFYKYCQVFLRLLRFFESCWYFSTIIEIFWILDICWRWWGKVLPWLFLAYLGLPQLPSTD
jgi:hypothetical protein